VTCPRCGATTELRPSRKRTASAAAAVLALGAVVLVGLAAVVGESLPTVTHDGWFSPSWPGLFTAILAITGALLLLGSWQLLARSRGWRCRRCGASGGSLPGPA
jgi:hypothetical protein